LNPGWNPVSARVSYFRTMSEYLLETAYFPNIQFFSFLATGSSIQVEAYEHYQKGSYRNRCHLAGPHGVQRLTVPLKKGKNEGMLITEVEISFEQAWHTQHWATIQSAYGKAPFFPDYAIYLQPILENPPTTLFALNEQIIHQICELLYLETPQKSTVYQTIVHPPIVDARGQVHPKEHRARPDDSFTPPQYTQVFSDRLGFLPNLSILDMLFCVGPETAIFLQNARF